MKIEHHDLVAELARKADELQRENAHYKEMCEKSDLLERQGNSPAEDTPDSSYVMVRESESPMVNHQTEFERKRIARLAVRNPAEAAKQSAELNASEAKQRPMTLSELLSATQQARVELRNAKLSGDSARIETAERRLRALHREKNRRGGLRVSC